MKLVFLFIVLHHAKSVFPAIIDMIQPYEELSHFKAYSIILGHIDMFNTDNITLTVFATNNEGMAKFPHHHHYNILWNICFEYLNRKNLEMTDRIFVGPGNGTLWVTNTPNGLFLNNAKILGEIRRERQIVYIIDNVIYSPIGQPYAGSTAFDIFSKQFDRTIHGNRFRKFFNSIVNTTILDYYKEDGPHTYFIPVDAGLTTYNKNLINYNILKGHMIRNRALFTRTALKNYSYDGLTDNIYFDTVIQFKNFKNIECIIINSYDEKYPIGRYPSEIVFGNIPFGNGVVHLISNPLCVRTKNRARLFPNLPVWSKISTDQSLSTAYDLGETSYVNLHLKTPGKTFTYFVPRDEAFRDYPSRRLGKIQKFARAFYGRHLVLSKIPYSMEDLEIHSRTSADGQVNLDTINGVVSIKVDKVGEQYVIEWKNVKISVYKADYECTDGLVHIIDGVFIDDTDIKNIDRIQDCWHTYSHNDWIEY